MSEITIDESELLALRETARMYVSQHSAIESQAEIIKHMQEALDDTRRLTRDLDVAMHGEEGAAKQASLCDMIEPAKHMRAAIKAQGEEIERLRNRMASIASYLRAYHCHRNNAGRYVWDTDAAKDAHNACLSESAMKSDHNLTEVE